MMYFAKNFSKLKMHSITKQGMASVVSSNGRSHEIASDDAMWNSLEELPYLVLTIGFAHLGIGNNVCFAPNIYITSHY